MGMTREARLRVNAAAKRMEEAKAETRRIVATGKCPQCGGGLRQNLSILGWWQCEQLGAETHRKDATKPSCNWQGFTS